MELKPLDGIIEIFRYQMIASFLALALVLGVNRHHGVSFAAGEGVMLFANAYLAWRVLRQRKTMRPMNLLLSFFGGEFGKYVLIILGTFLCFKLIDLNGLFYIIGLGVPQLGGVIIYGMRKSWRT